MEIYDKSIQMCRQAMEQASITSDCIACIGITNQRNTFVCGIKHGTADSSRNRMAGQPLWGNG